MILPSPIGCLSIALMVILYIVFLKIIAIESCSKIKTQFTYTDTKAEDRWQRCGRPKLIFFIIVSLIIVYIYFKYK